MRARTEQVSNNETNITSEIDKNNDAETMLDTNDAKIMENGANMESKM